MSQTIAIFGAGPGLGAAVARKFGSEGYAVALVSRNPDRLTGLRDDLVKEGVSAHVFGADLLRLDTIPSLVDSIRETCGSLDVLYLGATTDRGFTPAQQLTVETLDPIVQLFTYAAIASVRAVLPEMINRGAGSILYANGATALGAPPSLSGLGPALAATRNYLQTLHAETADRGVYVGALFIAGMIQQSAAYTAGIERDPNAFEGFPVVDPVVLAEALWDLHTERHTFERVIPGL